MIFRIYREGSMHVIEAPGGSCVVHEGGRAEELVLFEEISGGLIVERRLPPSVVVEAARRGYLGLTIREVRSPWLHPEIDRACSAG